MSDTNQTETTAAFNTLRAALQADQGYAWSWHCNIAMASFDAGYSHEVANRGAARFMSTCFGIDVTKFKEFQDFEPQWAEAAKVPTQFATDIQTFNGMYKMPVSDTPTLDVGVPLPKRLRDLKSIIGKELNEIDDIIAKADIYAAGQTYTMVDGVPTVDTEVTENQRWENLLDILTDMTDLMGDLQVYAASEMAKFGLPLDETLAIIMQSNFSKMGADGKPIYDEQGKLQKGPLYYKPEPELRKMLEKKLKQSSN